MQPILRPTRHVVRRCLAGGRTSRVNISRPISTTRPLKAKFVSRVEAVESVQRLRAFEAKEQAKRIAPWQAIPFTLASIVAAVIAFYGGQLLVAANQPCADEHISELSRQTDVSTRYDVTADTFDSEVGISEWLMGILGLRKRLAQKCKGHVLEVSCGTGRNLGYFDLSKGSNITSLTFIDLSAHMIDLCKKKWATLYDGRDNELKPGLTVRFLASSALEKMPLAPDEQSSKKYDTIFQTMGLCSTPTPDVLLRNIVQHLDTSNPDARIFLLEHGRSYREWLNNILDQSARKHAELHGCWFNRDIGAIVAEAAERYDLVVVEERRKHVGTTWMFELKPKYVTPKNSVPAAIDASRPRSTLTWIAGLFGYAGRNNVDVTKNDDV